MSLRISDIYRFMLVTIICVISISCGELPEAPEYELPEEEVEQPEIKNDEFVILFTNDFHSQIEPLGEAETYNAGRGGIKRIKALVDSVRAAEPYVLLADAGDMVQGTYYFSLLDGVVEMMILDELGYDVRTIGNHEFDKKIVGLGDMLSLSSVPVVASNYDFSNTALAQRVLPSVIVNAGALKIGFVGLNIRLLNLVDPTYYEGVVWQDAINVADAEAGKLRQKGADMVIALSHLGYQKDNDRPYYDRGIAMNTRNIDMIIGGHTHTFLNKAEYVKSLDGDMVPIVQTGSRGICLGYAKIKLDEQGKPSFDYRLIPVDASMDKRIDKEFSDMIDVYSASVTERMNEVLGYCPETLRKGYPESPLGNLTADGLIWIAKRFFDVDADVSLYNSGGIRAEVSKGNVTLGDVYAVYPFDNALSLVTMKGRDIKTLFEHMADEGGMPVNKAVKLVIKGKKVKSVTIDGKPVDDEKVYKVATIDYLVNTGRYGLDKALTRSDSAEMVRDYFGEYFRYLSAQDPYGHISASVDGRIVIEY